MNEGTDIRHIFLSAYGNPKLDLGCCVGAWIIVMGLWGMSMGGGYSSRYMAA